MIALPAIVAEQCVEASTSAAQQVKAIYAIGGPANGIAAALQVIDLAHWTILSDVARGDWRTVRLIMKPNTPYREIGAFIYAAQMQHLSLTSGFEPPICGTEKK